MARRGVTISTALKIMVRYQTYIVIILGIQLILVYCLCEKVCWGVVQNAWPKSFEIDIFV